MVAGSAIRLGAVIANVAKYSRRLPSQGLARARKDWLWTCEFTARLRSGWSGIVPSHVWTETDFTPAAVPGGSRWPLGSRDCRSKHPCFQRNSQPTSARNSRHEGRADCRNPGYQIARLLVDLFVRFIIIKLGALQLSASSRLRFVLS